MPALPDRGPSCWRNRSASPGGLLQALAPTIEEARRRDDRAEIRAIQVGSTSSQVDRVHASGASSGLSRLPSHEIICGDGRLPSRQQNVLDDVASGVDLIKKKNSSYCPAELEDFSTNLSAASEGHQVI